MFSRYHQPDAHLNENVMRRRRSRNRSEPTNRSGSFSALLRLVLLLIVLLPIAEWGASAIMSRLNAPSRQVQLSDKDIAKLFDSGEPSRNRLALEESPGIADAVYAPLVEYRLPARAGQLVNVDANGVRGGVRGDSGPRVVVFGGGATFGPGLADDQTISAAMADALAASGHPARVENRAVPGWYSTQDRIAFAEMLANGDKPDFAVFVHGIEDFLNCSAAERTAWSRKLASADEPVGLDKVARQSALAALFRRLSGAADPIDPASSSAPPCASDAQVDAALARLDANRRLIAAMGERFGVPVLFVQQPVPTFHYDNAKRTVPMAPERMVPFVATAKAYARLAEMRGTGTLWEQNLLWLAEIEPDQGNAYVDPVHYAPVFAKLIGDRIAARLVELLPAPPAPAAAPAADGAPHPVAPAAVQ